MATRKEARRRSLIQVLVMLVAVVIIVVGVVVFQNWSNSRSGTQPQDIVITATVGDTSMEILPYQVCEAGAECPEGEVPNLTVGPDDTLTLDIPSDLASNQWQLLTIYDDPAANDQQLHGAGETSKVSIPGSVDPIEASTNVRPHLQVVEISAVLIGKDTNGEETPVATTWSLSTMTDEELAAAKEGVTDAAAATSPSAAS